jgi:hypothetical protein
VKCPRCGADNGEGASWCSLCQYAFSENQGIAADQSLQEPQPQQPQGSGVQQQVGQAYSPGAATEQYGYPAAPGGYPPPPGAYPPGYAPPPQQHGLSGTTKVLAGIVALLVFLGLLSGGIFLIMNKSAKIVVPMPPDFEEATKAELKAMEGSMQSSSEDSVIDCYYVHQNGDGLVVAFHQKSFLAEKPPSDPDQMQEYYDRNKDEIVRGLNMGAQQAGSGVSAELGDYEVVTLACGESALRMTMDISMGRNSLYMEMLMLFKGSSGYGILFEAPDDALADETMQFLRDNISFE